tara:strand:+ start:28 stop:567 length:540 start_codon:yes stop_codon:yes gene_type:complete
MYRGIKKGFDNGKDKPVDMKDYFQRIINNKNDERVPDVRVVQTVYRTMNKDKGNGKVKMPAQYSNVNGKYIPTYTKALALLEEFNDVNNKYGIISDLNKQSCPKFNIIKNKTEVFKLETEYKDDGCKPITHYDDETPEFCSDINKRKKCLDAVEGGWKCKGTCAMIGPWIIPEDFRAGK